MLAFHSCCCRCSWLLPWVIYFDLSLLGDSICSNDMWLRKCKIWRDFTVSGEPIPPGLQAAPWKPRSSPLFFPVDRTFFSIYKSRCWAKSWSSPVLLLSVIFVTMLYGLLDLIKFQVAVKSLNVIEPPHEFRHARMFGRKHIESISWIS